MAIRVALIGAGLFATKEHLPAIQACSEFTLKAVCSRSEKSAQALAGVAKGTVDVYFQSPSTPDRSLETLLGREDIGAVIIVVPIPALADVVRQALKAGKHVLSEKPIAPDVETAKALIEHYREEANGRSLQWAVGENFRFWNSVQEAARQLKTLKGELLSFNISVANFTDFKNPFFNTEWRQKPQFQGGWLLDGGVHFTAVARSLLEATGTCVTSVSAFTSLLREDLAPADTIHAILRTKNQRVGTFKICLGSEVEKGMVFEAVTSKGKVRVEMSNVITTTIDRDGTLKEDRVTTEMTWGVKEEVAAFAKGISGDGCDNRLSASEALADLELLEAMLDSAKAEGRPVAVLMNQSMQEGVEDPAFLLSGM